MRVAPMRHTRYVFTTSNPLTPHLICGVLSWWVKPLQCRLTLTFTRILHTRQRYVTVTTDPASDQYRYVDLLLFLRCSEVRARRASTRHISMVTGKPKRCHQDIKGVFGLRQQCQSAPFSVEPTLNRGKKSLRTSLTPSS